MKAIYSQEVMKKEINQAVDALKTSDTLILRYKHLVPSILLDTFNKYEALYTDSEGTYLFEIKRVGKRFVVSTDGFVCSNSSEVDYIKWNFDSQLATYTPKVLS
jgi:hypothetical protein